MTDKPNQPEYEFEIPERSEILEFLQNAGQPCKRKKIAEALDVIDPDARIALGRRLKAMIRDGQLIKNRRGSYGLVTKMDLIPGKVVGHKDGYGFLIPDEGDKDLFLSAKQMRSVMHGDRAVVRCVHEDKQGRLEGELVEVIERANERVVGQLFKEGSVFFVVPDNPRIAQDVLIAAEDIGNAKPLDYVLIQIIQYPNKRIQAIGKVLEVLGQKMAADLAVEMAIRSFELPHEWPEELLNEIAIFNADSQVDIESDRKDYRDLPFVTIDGADARDFDDAVYCEKQGNGWRLCVAIADVSNYVRSNTALDAQAYERATSVYFPERVIPMLPEVLSNGLCSLNPNVDRLSLVCEMHLDGQGKLKRSEFFKGVIRSAARLTYDEMVNIVVDNDNTAREKREEVVNHLDDLYVLFQLVNQQRKKAGLVDFRSSESYFEFDDNGHIESIHDYERNNAHRLIEEFMLLANISAGQFLEKNEIPAPYRVHDTPKLEKLNDVRGFLKGLGLSLAGGESPTAKDYANVLNAIHEREDAVLIETILLRSMSLAVYSEENIGHFGLGFETYAHFTSPIRRYPDLIVHRAIYHLLNRQDKQGLAYDKATMQIMAEHCSHCERRAEEASRDVVQRLKCIYMQDKLGETFNGIVSSVTSFGLFVELDDIRIEGLIHISNLPADYYHHDAVKHKLFGEKTKREFELMQRLSVIVTRVDIDERKIDFELVDGGEE